MQPWLVPEAQRIQSPNRYKGRSGVVTDLLAIHYTAGPGNEESVGKLFAMSKRKASAHFAVGRAGGIVQCVALDDAAWHAGDGGKSRFPSSASLDQLAGVVPLSRVAAKARLTNLRSVGIEVCNLGYGVKKLTADRVVTGTRHRNPRSRSTSWERYPQSQIDALVELVGRLKAEVPTLRWLCGHEDVTHYDVCGGSKLDPGPAFPWQALASTGLTRVLYDFATKSWRAA